MLRSIILLCLILISFSCSDRRLQKEYPKIDIQITNALILDGEGSKPVKGDVFIVGDKIVKISQKKIRHDHILKTIDARGKYLAPGFIDLHSHGDPLETPDFENFLAMGVTTVSLGQDGFSPNYNDLQEWKDKVEGTGIALNIAMFVGHGSLRELFGINEKTHPSQEEIIEMAALLEQNLKICFGMSTGLEYTPGLYAEQNELLELAKIVGKNDRMIMSHMRNEDDNALIESIDELLAQGEFCRVHVAHLKSVYGKGSERAEEILDHLSNARNRGIDVTADVYPYTASYTGIAILFPDWCKTNEQFEIAKVERREELKDFIRAKVNFRNGPQATLLGTEPYKGKTLLDLEKEMSKPFEEILIDDIGPEGASGAYFVMNDTLQNTLIKDPNIGISSDGSETSFHPRGHGTFAKIIEEFVVKNEVLTLEAAVRKMTSYAADILKISDRGRIKEGMKADLILFDPYKVKSNATYSDPFQLSEGFDLVIVNGKVVRQNAQLSGDKPGVVLDPN
ncbi:N-acyl-D-amino-acid deacylase family protein [Namhaeicola litoreus]|uniref:Amidohydrolase family protein n=1 Tax=Namhaeicola litoreus TaxID=1052145 RepID=A0ABW3Y2X3_9FLAO